MDQLKNHSLSQFSINANNVGQGPTDEVQTTCFERYIADRICTRIRTKERWLDRMSLAELMESAELFGALFRQGPFKKLDLSFPDWSASAEIGFTALMGGREGFIRMLSKRIQNTNGSTMVAYAQLLGPVYSWLNDNREHSNYLEIVSTMQEFAERNLRSEYRRVFLGKPLTRVDGCTVAGLSETFDVKPRMVRVYLTRSDVKPSSAIQTITGKVELYPEQAARRAVRAWLNRITGKEARDYLCVSHPTFRSLVKFRVVTESRFPDLSRPRYSATALRTFCRRLDALAKSNPRPVSEHQHLNGPDVRLEEVGQAARRASCEIGQIFRLLLGNHLKNRSIITRVKGLPSIYVDADEIRSCLSLPKPRGFSEDEAAAKLGLSVHAVRSLQKDGFLTRFSARSPRTRKAVKRFSVTSVKEFDRKFVSQFALAGKYGMSRVRIVKCLGSFGCRPEVCVPKAPLFFRRSTVAKVVSRSKNFQH